MIACELKYGMWILLTACACQTRKIAWFCEYLQITFPQFNTDLHENGRKGKDGAWESIESPHKTELAIAYDIRFRAESSSYSYLLPAEAGVANWYHTIMLAIAPTTWRPGELRRFTDTQCAFLAGFQHKPVSRE